MLYVLLLRRHPLEVDIADRRKTIRAIALGEVCKPTDLNPAFSKRLQQIMMKSLAENPADRFQSAGEFGKQLRGYIARREEKQRRRKAAGGSNGSSGQAES